MNINATAVTESVSDTALSTLAPGSYSFETIPFERASRSPSDSEGDPQLGLGDYRVALISVDITGTGTRIVPHNTSIPHLLLLPLTWDDLLKQVRPDSNHSQLKGNRDISQFGEVWIDFLRYEARRADQAAELTAIEFKILKFFTSNPYRVISRGELLDKVWGYHCYPTTRTVDNKILSLRQKLELDPANPIHFQTVHGVGYKFVPCLGPADTISSLE